MQLPRAGRTKRERESTIKMFFVLEKQVATGRMS